MSQKEQRLSLQWCTLSNLKWKLTANNAFWIATIIILFYPVFSFWCTCIFNATFGSFSWFIHPPFDSFSFNLYVCILMFLLNAHCSFSSFLQVWFTLNFAPKLIIHTSLPENQMTFMIHNKTGGLFSAEFAPIYLRLPSSMTTNWCSKLDRGTLFQASAY